jgi:hypothetical protein
MQDYPDAILANIKCTIFLVKVPFEVDRLKPRILTKVRKVQFAKNLSLSI